jgi:hypothetical protein
MLKSKLVLFAVTLMLFGSVYAQSDQVKKPEAYKFAEFKNIGKAELKDKIHAFYVLLMGESNSQGVILNYGSVAAIRARRDAIRKAISDFKFEDSPRVTLLDGPPEPTIRTVLWVVPFDADWPKP